MARREFLSHTERKTRFCRSRGQAGGWCRVSSATGITSNLWSFRGHIACRMRSRVGPFGGLWGRTFFKDVRPHPHVLDDILTPIASRIAPHAMHNVDVGELLQVPDVVAMQPDQEHRREHVIDDLSARRTVIDGLLFPIAFARER